MTVILRNQFKINNNLNNIIENMNKIKQIKIKIKTSIVKFSFSNQF